MEQVKFNWHNTPKICISLERSVDRRKAIAIEFKKIGLKSITSSQTRAGLKHSEHINIIDAVDKRDLILPELSPKFKPGIDGEGTKQIALGALGCMLSHISAMKIAVSFGWEYIFICEDDITLCDDFNQRMAYIEGLCNAQVNPLQFDVLSLGGHFPTADPGELGTSAQTTDYNRIYRTMALGGSYGYIIRKPAYEFFIRNCNYNFGADQFLNDYVYQNFNCYAFLPFLIGHKAGKSEITEVEWHYEIADWFYQQQAIDINQPYVNHIAYKKAEEARLHDEAREKWLKANL